MNGCSDSAEKDETLEICNFLNGRIRNSACRLSSPIDKNIGSLKFNFGVRMDPDIYVYFYGFPRLFEETQTTSMT